MNIWLVVIGVLLLLTGVGYEAYMRRRDRRIPLPGRLVDVGGRRLHAVEMGHGGPTVVMIPGAGDSSDSWLHVQRVTSRFARTVAYDRPGLGTSDPGPAPSPEQFVSDLSVLLDRMGATQPVVLVGHSLGGLIARAFAARFPERVAGMVLLDSTPEAVAGSPAVRRGFAALRGMLLFVKWTSVLGLVRLVGDRFGAIPLVPERPLFQQQVSDMDYARWKASMYRNLAGDAQAEYPALVALAEACSPAARPGQFGRMPLAVLASSTYGPQWLEWQRELATRSSRTSFWISPIRGHNVHMTSPEAVVRAIQQVAEARPNDATGRHGVL